MFRLMPLPPAPTVPAPGGCFLVVGFDGRRWVYERRQRKAHPCAFLLSAFLRAKDEFDKRERSELPPVTDVSVPYVRVVVLGVLRRAVFWA